LFTGGKGKEKEKGKSLWSGEGLKYFKRAEKKIKRGICRWWEDANDVWWLWKLVEEVWKGYHSQKKIVTKHCIWSWRGGLQRIIICQGRLWNWNATSARRRRRTMGIVPIRFTIYW
jgi:hypothetical protein